MFEDMVELDLPESGGPYSFIPAIIGSFWGLWVLCLISWISNWMKFTQFEMPLHRRLTIVPLMKLVSLSVDFWSWSVCVSSGRCSFQLAVAQRVCDALFEVCMYVAILTVAKGYCITRQELEPPEKRSIVWNVAFLGIVLFLFSLVHDFFIFPLIIMYIVVFGQMFTSLAHNMRALHFELASLRSDATVWQASGASSGSDSNDYLMSNLRTSVAFHFKFMTFKKIQYSVSFFVSWEVMRSLVLQFFVDSAWVPLLVGEAIRVALLLSIGVALRLRDFDALTNSVLANSSQQQQQQSQAADAVDQPGGSGDLESGNACPNGWQLVPDGPMVVIQNPPSRREDGKLMPSIVMGVHLVPKSVVHNNHHAASAEGSGLPHVPQQQQPDFLGHEPP